VFKSRIATDVSPTLRYAPHRASNYVVTATVSEQRRKFFRVIFSRDGSVFVAFPYFDDSHGIMSVARVPGDAKSHFTIELTDSGKVTSRRVKYSHHTDGAASFSQDGQVKTMVRRKAKPLTTARGHLFTLIARGLDRFECADPIHDTGTPTPRRVPLTFNFEDREPRALRFVGRWFPPGSTGALQWAISKPASFTGLPQEEISLGPTGLLIAEAGRLLPVFLLAPPRGNPMQDYLLILSCDDDPPLGEVNAPMLAFMGGFDDPSVVLDRNQSTEFLVLMYPAVDYEELRTKLGTVDFDPTFQNDPSTN
jgi:hypothetical protein